MIKLKDLISEGKFKAKGKYLYMPGGEMSSIPKATERDRLVVQIKYDKFQLYSNSATSFTAYGPYMMNFRNLNAMVKWLNKEKAKYIGIDRL